MKYRLTVESIELNPHYAEELKKFNGDRPFDNHFGRSFDEKPPALETVVRVLSLEVSETEFAAIKKATLAAMD